MTLAGELLQQAELLLHAGLHTSEIIAGYTKAGAKALEYLEELVVSRCENVRDVDEVVRCIGGSVAAKQYGHAAKLSEIVARACIDTLPRENSRFNVDSVRVVKVAGGGVMDTQLVRGLALLTGAEGTIHHVTKAKIGVFVAGIDVPRTETKGTLRFSTAEELEGFSRGEEEALEQVVREIHSSGCNVVVSGQAVGDMAMHFLERYEIMVIKVPSKFQLRRLCKATGARPLVRLGAPTAEELGSAAVVSIDEVGSIKLCTVSVDADDDAPPISTILVRAATKNILDDIERCIDDGVHNFKALTRDNRFVAGAGATEIELARRLRQFGDSVPGLDQYAINKFAESLEVVPRVLAENSGMKSTEAISSLYAAHQAGSSTAGINIDSAAIEDSSNILDSFSIKHRAILLATEAAVTILNVDQIIMAKPAGPMLPRPAGPRDA
jgi:T-complex protein 1 subunit theta